MSKLERCFTTFLRSRVRFILVGGVLSTLALALIPHYAYATTDYSSDTVDGIFSANLWGGCHFRSMEITRENGSSLNAYLGDNFNNAYHSSYMCGYGFNNQDEFTWFSDDSAFANEVAFSDGVYTPDFFQSMTGGYIRNWGNFNDSPYASNTRNVIKRLHLHFDDTLTITPSSSSELSVYMPFVFVYDNVNGDLGASGMLPRIDKLLSDITFLKTNGDSLSSTDLTALENQFYNSVNSSLNLTCGAVPDNIPSDFVLDNNHCYVYGSFLLNAGYTYYFDDIVLTPSLPATYNYSFEGSLINDSFRYDFLHYSDLDYTTGAFNTTSSLELGYFRFYMKMCMTESECQNYANSFESQAQNRINNTTGGFNGSGDTNLFMSWFNVFNFGLVFPFTTFFNAFTDSQQCVNVPIIGGMLHNPNATYCSWWSSSIRSVLTPVFSIASIMLIFGFIMHWLRNGESVAIHETKQRKGAK